MTKPALAPIRRRILAYALDILMCVVVLLGIQAMLFPINPLLQADASVSGIMLHAWVTMTTTVPLMLFFGLSWASNMNATPGMRIMELRVRAVSAMGMVRGRALLRALVLLIPFEVNHAVMFYPQPIWNDPTPSFRIGFAAVYILLLGYVATALATPLRQGPHDLVAGTVVVRRAAA